VPTTLRVRGANCAATRRRAPSHRRSRSCSIESGEKSNVHPSKGLRRDAGLTLIEVLTAVSLLGVVTAMAATSFTAMMPGFRARGAALLVAGDLNQARMAAIKEGRVYEYFPISGGYRIRRDDGIGGREVVKEVVLANEYPHVSFGHTGVTEDPYTAPVGPAVPAGAITFHSNGTVQDPASVYVEAGSGDDLAQHVVTLSAAGRVRVWRHGDEGWK
jgi:prepilin-type N-terminal cleavage/methylation domain-containing protein